MLEFCAKKDFFVLKLSNGNRSTTEILSKTSTFKGYFVACKFYCLRGAWDCTAEYFCISFV